MKRILVTQRVCVDAATGERRDALDQRWHELFARCELLPSLVPNDASIAHRMLGRGGFDGLLLTGGNTLAAHGGDAPERDEVETLLLERALETELPVLGVCRGMQLVLERFGVRQIRVEGHVQARQTILADRETIEVNSYHEWGCRTTALELAVWARADDGVVKAVRHVDLPVVGIMWHPERIDPLRDDDVALLRRVFRCGR